VITRMLNAGGIITGRAVCENLCHSATSHSSATGVVHNPYARACNSGGSSSGSGALIANADVDMAIRADQGGSIREERISSMCYPASKLLLTSLITCWVAWNLCPQANIWLGSRHGLRIVSSLSVIDY
jgi:hypothetical protein